MNRRNGRVAGGRGWRPETLLASIAAKVAGTAGIALLITFGAGRG